MDITDFKITSVLLYLNHFCYQANLKLIPLTLLNIRSKIERQSLIQIYFLRYYKLENESSLPKSLVSFTLN